MKCWLSQSTLRLIRSKRLCYRRMKSDTSLWPRYKCLRNEVRNLTRRDYKIYLESITNNLHHTQKPFWSWINKTRACRSPIPSLIHNDDVVSSDNTKAALFNDYFVSVFTKEDTSNLDDLRHHLSDSHLDLDGLSVSTSEVLKNYLS